VKSKLTWGEFTRFGPTEFSPDSRTLVHADHEGRLTVWDTSDAREIYHRRLPGPVTSVAIAPGGRYLATGNSNGTIFIVRLP
jgi:WD40 repeat protein